MGRPFGIPVHVSPTWFLVAALITYFFAPLVADRLPGIGFWRYAVAFAFAVLLYASVFVHELSHSVVARWFGLPVRRITLYLLGGVSEIEREPPTPLREFLVAFAGPLLSLALGVGGLGLALVLPAATVPGVLAYELALANLLVGVFNLLPGLPLDGGRMLRAGVWRITGRPAAATLAAAWGGRILGVLVFLTPFAIAALRGTAPGFVQVIWAALIGSFLWVGAGQALRAARFRERLSRVAARELVRPAVSVAGDTPLAEALRRADDGRADDRRGGDGRAAGLVVVDPDGTPIALVSDAAVSATPAQRRPWVDVGSMARTLRHGQVLSADLTGSDLLSAMRETPSQEYLLVEGGGRTYGVLRSKDVENAFSGT